ncbi:hypothetical protein CUJ84_Chr000831 [Rhizobium leguminosarum]|uniref:Uncharacterized protein n=1 Tax=Rhizobium leguminosarum TaxID=384 RepID=A0A2K9YZ08_RHILE|nr:hypothetical protein CUJ84_Chr000831 [Rhizobium leguminosarum]
MHKNNVSNIHVYISCLDVVCWQYI